MSAPLRSTPRSSALPASQTAPVAEFRCLFTHDIRRKQKRWQDGYLKFHTFNSRVMVCDQSRNHIGDTYWKESNELQEGDELTLDKGVMVEVAEAMGTTQTDLTPLFEKKPKEQAKEPAARPTPSSSVRPFQRPTSVAPSSVVRTGTQLRHKSLNTLLGTPRGPVGKAVPMKSPYEERREKETEEERAPKRLKTVPRTTGWRASSPVQEEPSPHKPQPVQATVAGTKVPPLGRLPSTTNVITISSESDHIPILSSQVTLPSPPAKVVKSTTKLPATSTPSIQSDALPEPPSETTPKPSRTKIRLPKAKKTETPKRAAPPSSPPVSASNRLTNVDFAVQSAQKPRKQPSPQPSPPRNPKAKSLRLSTGVKRGTLMCQSIPNPASRVSRERSASVSKPNSTKTSRLKSKEPSPAASISSKGSARNRKRSTSKPLSPKKSRRKTPEEPNAVLENYEDVFDDPEVVHGLMDQQLLIISSPIELPCAPSSPLSEIFVTKPTEPKDKINRALQPENRQQSRPSEVEHIELMPPSPLRTTKKAQPKKQTTAKVQAARTVSPPQIAVLEPPLPPLRETSPAHDSNFVARLRTASTSPGKSALSTGGFRKKVKSASKQATTDPPPAIPIPDRREETVALPPHPLRGGKKGALMSTTELASLLQKPKKRPRPNDPIEDDGEPSGKSPTRKIRRVRSENDAPIPSTAEDWEKRNLPKTSSNLTEAETPSVAAPPEPKKKISALAALVKRTDPRKKFARAQSLNVETNVPAVEELPSPVIDNDVGPWSTEAFDLFDWRPPNREEGDGGAE